MEAITQFDFSVLDAIAKLHSSVLNIIMKFFTTLGDNGYLWIGLCIVLICIPKTRKIGIFAAITLAVEFILNDLVIKNIVARERPFIQHSDIKLLISPPHGYSFPSGHSASSFATAFAVFLRNKKIGIPCLVAAALIAFSRLYFYVHFPTDVLAGILFGTAIAVIIYFVEKKIRTSKTK